MRPSQRKPEEIRNIKMTRQYTKHPPGSVLVEFGDTKVLCTASVRSGVPRFLKDSNQGWLTAEYGMLPGAPMTAATEKPPEANKAAAPLRFSVSLAVRYGHVWIYKN